MEGRAGRCRRPYVVLIIEDRQGERHVLTAAAGHCDAANGVPFSGLAALGSLADEDHVLGRAAGLQAVKVLRRFVPLHCARTLLDDFLRLRRRLGGTESLRHHTRTRNTRTDCPPRRRRRAACRPPTHGGREQQHREQAKHHSTHPEEKDPRVEVYWTVPTCGLMQWYSTGIVPPTL